MTVSNKETRNKKVRTQRTLKNLGFDPSEIAELCGTLGIVDQSIKFNISFQ